MHNIRIVLGKTAVWLRRDQCCMQQSASIGEDNMRDFLCIPFRSTLVLCLRLRVRPEFFKNIHQRSVSNIPTTWLVKSSCQPGCGFECFREYEYKTKHATYKDQPGNCEFLPDLSTSESDRLVESTDNGWAPIGTAELEDDDEDGPGGMIDDRDGPGEKVNDENEDGKDDEKGPGGMVNDKEGPGGKRSPVTMFCPMCAAVFAGLLERMADRQRRRRHGELSTRRI